MFPRSLEEEPSVTGLLRKVTSIGMSELSRSLGEARDMEIVRNYD